MPATVVIPARFASSRFPAKMIAAETGKPLVQHVVEQVKKAKRVRNVIVATDDSRIVAALKPFGTIVTKTLGDHQSGTDRIWEVVSEWPGELIVNVQGDEPEIEPETIDVHFGGPVPQAVHHHLQHSRMAQIHGIPRSRVVYVVAVLVRHQPVIRSVIDSLE